MRRVPAPALELCTMWRDAPHLGPHGDPEAGRAQKHFLGPAGPGLTGCLLSPCSRGGP